MEVIAYDVANCMDNAMFTKAGIVTLNQVNTYNGNGQRVENSENVYKECDTETAIYFYGESFDNMKKDILEFVNTYPLCKGAIIVKIA